MTTNPQRETKYARLIRELTALLPEFSTGSDSCLPSERDLCDRFGVSRITVRRALAELEESGAIYRVPGKGAFVRGEKLTQRFSALTSFTEDMHNRSLHCGSQVLAFEAVAASEKVARQLRVEVNSQVYLLKRLRMAAGTPLAIETCYLPREIGAVVKHHISDDMSLYTVFREHCGVCPMYAEQSLEAGMLQSWEYTLLGDNAPVYAMCVTRLVFDREGQPIEYVEGKYRGDRYSYHISMNSNESQVMHRP